MDKQTVKTQPTKRMNIYLAEIVSHIPCQEERSPDCREERSPDCREEHSPDCREQRSPDCQEERSPDCQHREMRLVNI